LALSVDPGGDVHGSRVADASRPGFQQSFGLFNVRHHEAKMVLFSPLVRRGEF
jgi:hypothetical protein